MQFILSTLFTAMPAVIPVFVLMCTRIRPMRYRTQHLLMKAALALYIFGIAGFAAHAWQLGLGASEFFNAFYGAPQEKTLFCYAGYAGQGFAAFAVMLIINWGALVTYFGRKPALADGFKEPEAAAGKTESK